MFLTISIICKYKFIIISASEKKNTIKTMFKYFVCEETLFSLNIHKQLFRDIKYIIIEKQIVGNLIKNYNII